MRNYELTVILPASPKAASRGGPNKTIEEIEKRVESASGKVEKITEWGSRQLAYKIKKQDSGDYFLLNLLLSADRVSDLDRYLQVNESVLRHLLVLREGSKEKKVEEKTKEPKSRRTKKR